jgi:cell shape-determining protein MreC
MTSDDWFSLLVNTDVEDLNDTYVKLEELIERLVKLQQIQRRINELEAEKLQAKIDLREIWWARFQKLNLIDRMITINSVDTKP